MEKVSGAAKGSIPCLGELGSQTVPEHIQSSLWLKTDNIDSTLIAFVSDI